jgi:hypothetical protein
MRPSSRPSLRVSELPVLDVDLSIDGKALVICRDCGRWIRVRRGLVMTHSRTDDERCSGSAQHLLFDLTASQWADACATALNARRQAVRTAPSRLIHPTSRRATPVSPVRYPAKPTSVVRLARPTAPRRAQVRGHAPDALARMDKDAKNAARSN